MTKREVIDYCLGKAGAYEDYPFGGLADENPWAVLRHGVSRRSFACVYERLGATWVNLKCDPQLAELLRKNYCSLLPAYHMNKTHWNSVILGGDVSDEKICELIDHSYELTTPKARSARAKK